MPTSVGRDRKLDRWTRHGFGRDDDWWPDPPLVPTGVRAMPRPVPDPIRAVIWRRCRLGQTAAQIAEELDLAPRTVRRLVQRFGSRGEPALRPGYRRRPPDSETRPGGLLAIAWALRQQHPLWGAPLIRSLLLRDYPQSQVPSARTIQRLFRRLGAGRPPRPEAPPPQRRRAERPHEVWQMDASERIAPADATEVCWLRIVDEYTGAFLLTRVFSPGAVDGRAGGPNGRDPAPGLRDLGPAGPHPRGPRPPLGLADGGPADGVGAVAAGPGDRPGAHPSASAGGQRRRRVRAAHGAAVGRPAAVRLGGRAAAPARRDGSAPARMVPGRGAESDAAVPRPGAFRPRLPPRRGGLGMAARAGAGGAGGVRGGAPGQRAGPGVGLWPELLGAAEVRGRIGVCAAGRREQGLVDRVARRPADRSASGRVEPGGDPGPAGDPSSSWPGPDQGRGPRWRLWDSNSAGQPVTS